MNKIPKTVITLTMILLIIISVITVIAIITDDNGSPYVTTSLRGEQVEMYGGSGLYAYNTVEKAIMMRAFDWYYLLGGIPILIIGMILFSRKSVIGYFILVSSLFFWVYNFIINSISIAFNKYFLIYMIVYVISIFTVVFLIKGISFEYLQHDVLPKMPIKFISIFVFLLASYFIISWLIIDFTALFLGTIHPNLDIYTTADLNVTDLSIYAPLSITAGVLLLKRNPLGAILSTGIILMAFQEMCALSMFSFLKVSYLKEGMAQIELPILVFVPVCLAIGIYAIFRLKGMKYVLRDVA